MRAAGAAELVEALRSAAGQLREVVFEGHRFEQPDIVASLLGPFHGSMALEVLDFTNSSLGPEGAPVEVGSCEKLRELKLEDCELGGDGCEAVARALSGLTSLEVLDLRNNDMDDSAECVALLAEALRGNARLKKVALDEDLDVEALREALREAGVEAALHLGEDDDEDDDDEEDDEDEGAARAKEEEADGEEEAVKVEAEAEAEDGSDRGGDKSFVKVDLGLFGERSSKAESAVGTSPASTAVAWMEESSGVDLNRDGVVGATPAPSPSAPAPAAPAPAPAAPFSFAPQNPAPPAGAPPAAAKAAAPSAAASEDLINAAEMGDHDALVKAIGDGADVDTVDVKTMAPLHWAAKCGRHEDIVALVGAGADVNKTTKAGVTPLIYAASEGWDDCVPLLLSSGADASLKTQKGRTALDAAREKLGKVEADERPRFSKVVEQLSAAVHEQPIAKSPRTSAQQSPGASSPRPSPPPPLPPAASEPPPAFGAPAAGAKGLFGAAAASQPPSKLSFALPTTPAAIASPTAGTSAAATSAASASSGPHATSGVRAPAHGVRTPDWLKSSAASLAATPSVAPASAAPPSGPKGEGAAPGRVLAPQAPSPLDVAALEGMVGRLLSESIQPVSERLASIEQKASLASEQQLATLSGMIESIRTAQAAVTARETSLGEKESAAAAAAAATSERGKALDAREREVSVREAAAKQREDAVHRQAQMMASEQEILQVAARDAQARHEALASKFAVLEERVKDAEERSLKLEAEAADAGREAEESKAEVKRLEVEARRREQLASRVAGALAVEESGGPAHAAGAGTPLRPASMGWTSMRLGGQATPKAGTDGTRAAETARRAQAAALSGRLALSSPAPDVLDAIAPTASAANNVGTPAFSPGGLFGFPRRK